MFNALFLFFSFLILIWIYWLKFRKIDLGFITISIYFFVSLIGVFYLINSRFYYKSINWDITFIPYLYLFIVFVIFLRPILMNHQNFLSRLQVKNIKPLYYFATIYIFCFLHSSSFQIVTVIENLQSADWLSIRDQVYYDEDFILYDSQLERITRLFISVFRLPAIFLFFYFLSKKQFSNIFFIILFLLAITLPSIFTAIETAGRGNLIAFFFELLTCYFVFKKDFSNKTKKIFYFSTILILFFSINYIIEITSSRFHVLDQSSSILYYLSHSFLTFNDGLFNTIHSYTNGKYFFNYFFEDQFINYDSLGTNFGTSFFTFIGSLIIDFGPVGTFSIALFVSSILKMLFNNNNISFGVFYLYLFYINYLINGVFVIGLGNSLDWIFAILFILILKLLKV